MSYAGDDFYCDVALKGAIALRKEYESENVLAYHHTRPHWPVHIVVVPKKHIADFMALHDEPAEIIEELLRVLRTISAQVKEREGAARILTNLGRYQDSKHLHFHINAGDPIAAGR